MIRKIIAAESRRSMYLSETNFNFQQRSVLIRIDCDVDLRKEGRKLVVDEDFRLRSALPTIHFLRQKGAKRIILLGHLGRPEGKKVKHLSLSPVADWFSQNLAPCSLIGDYGETPSCGLFLLENLRFHSGEEKNSDEFAQQLAQLGDVYINDAFGVSHRAHASVVGLPRFLPSFGGFRLEAEMRVLSWLKKSVFRPLVFVLGGSKKGKLDYLKFLSSWADFLLVGGKLPLEMGKVNLQLERGQLKKNGKDINRKTIEKFKKIIQRGKTIIWAGPMGVYEEKGNEKGTFAIAKAIAAAAAFKVAGGGDTHRIISRAGLWGSFHFVSVGGGAMLQFLQDETLPGIEVLQKN